MSGILQIKNVRLFVAFRVLFNNRFYYPVFTVLFVDYGLTIEEFSLLNTIWALTVVAAEVPSGALADAVGRKRLLVAAAVLTICELALIAFAPLGDTSFLFSLFLISRILSGLADAAASGADEAIAYDSLTAVGLATAWPKVLSVQMRLTSLMFVISSISGAWLYDPAAMNGLLSFFGLAPNLAQTDTMRFPMYATLALALVNLPVTLALCEPARPRASHSFRRQLRRGFANIVRAGRWIITTRLAMAIILIGMAHDHILRLTATLTSQYFRLCHLSESRFGLINAAVSVIGLFAPKLAEWLVVRFRLGDNWLILALISLSGLFLLSGFQLWPGIIGVLLTFMGMMLTSFFTSHYLNAISAGEIRATVLSFKGMIFNLGYGLAGILFALALRAGRQTVGAEVAFQSAVMFFPWYLLLLLLALVPLCLSWTRAIGK
ncbi:MAG: MFS transporter [Desulfobulbaceae bacterium]|jgi:MFS family permease|nr:MFS transporter [Desulfobulbaceae bacterium]